MKLTYSVEKNQIEDRKIYDTGGTATSSVLKVLFLPPETSRKMLILSNEEPQMAIQDNFL